MSTRRSTCSDPSDIQHVLFTFSASIYVCQSPPLTRAITNCLLPSLVVLLDPGSHCAPEQQLYDLNSSLMTCRAQAGFAAIQLSAYYYVASAFLCIIDDFNLHNKKI